MIEWTDETWNPIRGCSRVSEECLHCYAEIQATKFGTSTGPFQGFAILTNSGPRWTGQVELIEHKLEEPLRWRKPRRIFVNSMSDLFHEQLSEEDIAKVFAVMHRADWHTYQILTKRARRMAWITPRMIDRFGVMKHVWLGVSAGSQRWASERIPLLLETPAVVQFVSYEPALGPVDFRPWLYEGGLDWIITGGESGPGARPFDPAWGRCVIAQCRAANVPNFVKQMGDAPLGLKLTAKRGGDPEEWPEDLRVREFPR
jgi:protein gp37